MKVISVADRKREIYDLLKNPDVKTVVLSGKPGVGKTWTAREVSNVAKRKGIFDIVLWLYLNREYDKDTLQNCIAQQLSLLSTRGISEVEDDDEETKEEVLKPNALPRKIHNKKLLIVLDDEDNKMDEAKARDLLDHLLELNNRNYKVLITTRKNTTNTEEGRKNYTVEPMVREESLSLLKERAFSGRKAEGFESLAEEFLDKTECMPNAIIMMAKAFKYFSDKKGGVELLRRSFEELSVRKIKPYDSKIYNITDLLCSGYNLVPYNIIIDCQRDAKDEKKQFFTDSRCINHNQLIAYWMMEGYLGPVNCMEKVYRKGHDILMELLDFQILKRAEADYVTINPLKDEFDEFILRKASDFYCRGYYVNARLGLDSVFGSVEWKGLVRISHKGGFMRTVPGGKEKKKVSALILDGNSLAKDLPSKFFDSLEALHFLAIFNPTLDILSLFSVDIIRQLHVFILRNCWFMKNMDRLLRIENFEKLTVLEISGPVEKALGPADSSGTEKSLGPVYLQETKKDYRPFTDGFFTRMPNLESINLSSLPFTELPESLFKLAKLKWLILRNCTSLKTLNSLRDCPSLLMVDCSGSTSLEDVQDRSFSNVNLEMVNLSDTKIKIIPLIGNLKNLTHLLLSRSLLNRLRNISNMDSLEVLDLSNSEDFNEFFDKSLEKLVNLKVLDLSGTAVSTLPSNVGDPLHLYLENCTGLNGEGVLECLKKVTKLERFVFSNSAIQSLPSISHLFKLRQLSVTRCLNLEAVPDLSSLKNMEELDLSGCEKIILIQDKTFDKMSHLDKLNLSGTSIETLPSIANLSNLRVLLIKDCKKLKSLPSLDSKSLVKLEEMNMSGCEALEKLEDNFFDGVVNLHILNLSDTLLGELPSLSKLNNLLELHLRNCKGLKSVPGLETLITLEILDLSGSAVSDLPILTNFSKLRRLMLKDCSSLGSFREMKTLDALGASVQNLPYGISGLTSLERLDLPNMDYIEGADSNEANSARDDNNELKPVVTDSNEANSAKDDSNELKPVVADSIATNSNVADRNEKKNMEEKSDGCEWGISSLSAPKEKRPYVSVSGTQFLQPPEKDSSLWESELKKFHLCVYPIKEFNAKNVLHFYGDDFIYRDIYLENRHIGGFDDQRLLEIYGFPGYKPEGMDKVLSHVNQIFFVDNELQVHVPAPEIKKEKTNQMQDIPAAEKKKKEIFQTQDIPTTEKKKEEVIQTLASFLTACDSKQMKGCWIEKCRKIEVVISEKEIGEIMGLLNLMETLWVSNAMNLKSILEVPKKEKQKQSPNREVFQNLRQLYLECCPKLSTVLSLSQLPQNLKILQIKFCDKLAKVFDLTQEVKLQHLETLHLWELPELESIGCQMPSLKTIRISNCPNLKKMEETIKSAEVLQYLSISNVHDLVTIVICKELKSISVDSCPNLLKICTLSKPASDLEIRIRFCNKLESVFEEGDSSEIKLLHLLGLPKLKSIGATLSDQVTRSTIDCLNLKI